MRGLIVLEVRALRSKILGILGRIIRLSFSNLLGFRKLQRGVDKIRSYERKNRKSVVFGYLI